jgi:hypothetical protein
MCGLQGIVGWVTQSLPTDIQRQISIPPIAVENASQFSTLRSLPAGKAAFPLHELPDDAKRPFQKAEWNPRGGERAAWMPREA